jgi:oxygen-independent coproporphyrinogen-3 oxidase
MTDFAGVYISVPFCKAKCTYCNFASGVFGPEKMALYVDRVCEEIARVRTAVAGMPAALPTHVDTIFLGGGTPSLLSAQQMRQLFAAIRGEFNVAADAEITLECAPGQLSHESLQEMLRLGMNRISFGVQSFVDAEARAVGRLHTRDLCLAEIDRMRTAGLVNINLDLIAGLPGQTAASWRESVETAIATAVPHISVYMLEVDEDSRLGREMLASGAKYSAHSVPLEDEIADWYAAACGWLEDAGVRQYEISNFARAGQASRHNMKYWRRQPYVGFGLDAHSMLSTAQGAVRWSNTTDLDDYLGAGSPQYATGNSAPLPVIAPARQQGKPERTGPERIGPERIGPERIGPEQAFEETLFLGLRMNEGISLARLRADFGPGLAEAAGESMQEMQQAGMLRVDGDRVTLTANGRMASNEVFSRLLVAAVR